MNKEELEKFREPPIKRSVFAIMFPMQDKQEAESTIRSMLRGYADIQGVEQTLSRLSDELRNDCSFMLNLIEIYPRAYLYAGEKLKDDGFLYAAMNANPSTYFLATEEQRSNGVVLGQYIDACYSNLKEPDESIDLKGYYSVEKYAKAYEELLLNTPRNVGRFDGYLFQKEVEFIKRAEKANPDMAKQYKEARESTLKRNVNMVCAMVTSNDHWGEYRYWMNEVRRTCPEMEQADIQQYRLAHKDELFTAFRATKNSTSFPSWLQHEVRNHSEYYPSDFVEHVNCGRIPGMSEMNLNWQIDGNSVYAQIAQSALVQHDDMSEQEAANVIYNATYQDIESKMKLMPAILDTAQSVCKELGITDPIIKQFQSELIGYAHSQCATKEICNYIHNKSWQKRGGMKQQTEEIVAHTLKAARVGRELVGLNAQPKTMLENGEKMSLSEIKELEMKSDMLIAGPLLNAIKVPVDLGAIIREYDSRTDYAEKYPWLNQKDEVDQFFDFLSQNEDAVREAIKDGRISIQDIANVLGQKYEVGATSHTQEQSTDITPTINTQDGPNDHDGIDEISL